MKNVYMTPVVVDFSGTADTAALTWTIDKAGVLDTSSIFGILEEAVASGGFTTTAGDFTVSVEESGGSEAVVATWSTGTTSTARAIGYHAVATTDATNAPDGFYKFGALATIRVKNDAQGAGGTVTGTARVHLPISFDAG